MPQERPVSKRHTKKLSDQSISNVSAVIDESVAKEQEVLMLSEESVVEDVGEMVAKES